ncbi:MAG: hypothetical protein IPL29_12190 [Propionivibrio sp.]|nr:hypothetical protein [Propionivibrio sp.]
MDQTALNSQSSVNAEMQMQATSRVNRLLGQLKAFEEWESLTTAQTGKSRFDQLREIRALRKCGGQCGISDYYNYRLYDESYQPGCGADGPVDDRWSANHMIGSSHIQ